MAFGKQVVSDVNFAERAEAEALYKKLK